MTLAYETERAAATLVGYNADLEETWEWQGATWTRPCNPAGDCEADPSYDALPVAYDPGRGSVSIDGVRVRD